MFRQGGLTPSVTEGDRRVHGGGGGKGGNDATNFLSSKFYRAFRCAVVNSTPVADSE